MFVPPPDILLLISESAGESLPSSPKIARSKTEQFWHIPDESILISLNYAWAVK